MGKVDGKIALITGGSEGIGLASAEEFVAEGAYVFITGRRQEVLDRAVKQIGKNIRSIVADSTKSDDLDNVYKIIQEEKGKLDILFVNAGKSKPMLLELITEQAYYDIFDLNVKGVLFTVQKSLPILNDGASIIINASATNSAPSRPGTSLYSATKATVRSFVRCWCVELKDRHIRVNALSPGYTDTPLLNNLGKTEEESKAILERFPGRIVMGRLDQASEIAKTAVFLASDDSSYITGIELFVDGGCAQI